MIDVCVVNYNTQPLLERFLRTLNESDKSLWNLWVTDNGSLDDSERFLWQNADRYNIDKAFYRGNVGFARACNGLAMAGNNEIIGLFNADVWFEPEHISYLLNVFDENPNVAILGPKQRNERGEVVHAGIFGTMAAPKHRGWKEYDPHDIAYKDFQPCITVSGSAYLIRRSVWEELTNCDIYQKSFIPLTEKDGVIAPGAFLPTPHYYEESFCSYHALTHGYEVWYDGRMPSIGHTWHASSKIGGPSDAYFHTSQQIFRAACDAHQIPHD